VDRWRCRGAIVRMEGACKGRPGRVPSKSASLGGFPMSRHAPGGLVHRSGANQEIRARWYLPYHRALSLIPPPSPRHNPHGLPVPLHPASGRVRQTPSQSVGPSVAPALLLNVRRAVHAPFDAPDGPSRPASVVTCFPPAPQVPSRHRKGRRISSLKSSFQ
jgi:hypothetical protein